jgi:hypothetical protein
MGAALARFTGSTNTCLGVRGLVGDEPSVIDSLQFLKSPLPLVDETTLRSTYSSCPRRPTSIPTNQDRFPIENVGNDRDGHGFSITHVGNNEKERFPFSAFALARRSITARKREDKLHGNDQSWEHSLAVSQSTDSLIKDHIFPWPLSFGDADLVS